MGTILKGLHRVRRHELQHANRPAEAVPGLLGRLARGDGTTAEAALDDLGLRLAHLAVLDATVAAVPHLWDLAATRTVRARPGVLALLNSVPAHGGPPRAEVQRAAHLAVRQGRATADRLTRDADPAVAAAHELLAETDGHRCETCER
ncbi:hypothetical protein [Streptomyces sp. TLI_171]|uniref:hypothetical protein n=1 Tax=Streptomyces sp. TLI_171 TaxID=1938859 RepID=UPI000C17D8C5|nr:hypothetical protein [Streptomyces sp. TLI_171]RKE22840.1 hypothetical protein BX266_6294 [Streptomyces sp. TLI_171]